MADRIFTLGLIVFLLGFLGLGVWHYDYGWTVLRFPVLIGLSGCLICLGNLALAGPEPAAAQPVEKKANGTIGLRQALPAMAWIVALLPVIWVLGYVIGLTLYVFTYLKTHGQSWTVSAVLAACTLIVVYGGFVRLLGISLPVWPIGF